jgi:tetratricopeptide (TPR) repeat protein
LWETNFATTEEIEPVDVFLRNGIGKNPAARFERMQVLLNENKGNISPALAAQFMGDHMDMCSDSMRPAGGIVSQLTNVTSAVFSPSDFNFWVADGLCPVCNNSYRGFNLTDEFADDGSAGGPGPLAPNNYVETDDYAALREYYDAAVSFMIPPGDADAALRKLGRAIALKPEEAIYRRLAAKMLLRRAEPAAATEHLAPALECVQSPSELAQAHLLLGFASDLLGRRSEALGCYREALKIAERAEDGILSCVNRFVIADAEKYSRVPFTSKDIKKIEISFDVTAKYDL